MLAGLFTVTGMQPMTVRARGPAGLWYLRIADHHVYGWVMGRVAELAWLGWLYVRN